MKNSAEIVLVVLVLEEKPSTTTRTTLSINGPEALRANVALFIS